MLKIHIIYVILMLQMINNTTIKVIIILLTDLVCVGRNKLSSTFLFFSVCSNNQINMKQISNRK